MTLLNLNNTRIKKLYEIIKLLYPEYNSICIFKNGTIIFRKKWYSIKYKVANALDLCLTDIPLKISLLAEKHKIYHLDMDNVIYISIIARKYNTSIDLIDKYQHIINKIKFPVKWHIINTNSVLMPKVNTIWDLFKIPKVITERNQPSHTDFKSIIKKIKTTDSNRLFINSIPASLKRWLFLMTNNNLFLAVE